MSHIDSNSDRNDSKSDKPVACALVEEDRKTSSKVGIGLIETILGEMKSEFNREVNIIENVKKDKDEDKCLQASKGLIDDESLTVKDETQEIEAGEQKQGDVNLDTESGSTNQKSSVVYAISNTSEKESDIVNSAEIASEASKIDSIVGKASSDVKPRIVITLKTSEDTSEGTKKIKAKSTQDSESNSEELWSLVSPELKGEKSGDTSATPQKNASPGLASGKRSLRSQAATATVKATLEEPAGVKRSARRRSKDSPRESVLQSAIARKEKSFSNLSQGEDKSSAARNLKVSTYRSPRLSPIEKNQAAGTARTCKSPVRAPLPQPKPSRLSQQNLYNDQAPKSNKSEDNANTTAESTARSSSTGNKSALSVTSKTETAVKTAVKSQNHVQSSNPQTYTKTGKRRYRPYKGLRYSFTGNNVRRTKPSRRHIKECNSSISIDAAEKKSVEPEEPQEAVVMPEEPPATVPSQQEELECADPIAESHAAEFPSMDLAGEFLQRDHRV
jgi:hypothetical protein